MAARPGTLAASVAPVLVGVAVSVRDGRVRTLPGLGALVVALAIQIGVNYSNDYSDFVRGADTPDRIGPLRAAASGLVAPGTVRRAAIISFAVAAVAGLGVSLLVDWRLLAVGAACIAAAHLYTGGPRPYGYLGLGEIFVFVFFGLVATCGTQYAVEGRVTALGLAGGAATGALATSIMLLNNIRDAPTDAAAGKRTLAVRAGRPAARRLLGAVLVLPFALVLAAVAAGWTGRAALVTLLCLPLAVAPARAASAETGPELVAGLRGAARLELAFGLAWALGVVMP